VAFQKKLLQWFCKNARPLPWRKHYRPYEVWVSEIMLQQTQVETMLPYFGRWMKTFPTLKSLANAEEEKVLKVWQGLGYYSRARNLHKSAKFILENFGGVFPNRLGDIRSLKGVGRYTAGAIASIAFNEEAPIVDGNVLRVLSRIYAIKKPIDVEKNKETFWKLETDLIPKGKARFFNQALMELGALVCSKENPLCGTCPVKSFCCAFKESEVENYPVRAKQKKTVKVEASAVVFAKNGRYLIQRRPVGKIMGGLWEFPEWKLAKQKTLTDDQIKRQTAKLVEGEFKIDLPRLNFLKTIKRNYTHHLERLHVFEALLSCGPTLAKNDWPAAWVNKGEFEKYPFSSAHSKLVDMIKDFQVS
jgi:A/G-specific adenine glycosylase